MSLGGKKSGGSAWPTKMRAEDLLGPPGTEQINNILFVILTQDDMPSVDELEGLLQGREPEEVANNIWLLGG